MEVDAGAWRLRLRPKVADGIDRLVLIERWLDPAEWQELQVVWTYNYKPVVVEASSGYSYSLPYRLALAHPCRAWWFAEHGVWIDLPRCASFGECTPMTTDWNLFNQALAAWRQDPDPSGSYCFDLDGQEYCFSAEEEAMGVEILNEATYAQLTEHCYSSTLANSVLANRPFASIAEYDATYGVGSTPCGTFLFAMCALATGRRRPRVRWPGCCRNFPTASGTWSAWMKPRSALWRVASSTSAIRARRIASRFIPTRPCPAACRWAPWCGSWVR
mgnify:CR=1 FL=1